jgi:hypothetical protein
MTDILISEINSSSTGGDFFVLYNFGATGVDMTGWRWTDSEGDEIAAFPADTTLAAGQRLIVLSGDVGDVAAFRAAWGLPDNMLVVAVGGPGLSKGDGVQVLDGANALVAGVSFGTTGFTSIAVGTPAIAGSGNVAASHTGPAFGGVGNASAVWDGASTLAPAYTAAVAGTDGAYEQESDATSVGSPGGTFIAFSAATIDEAAANDGSITAAIDLTLRGDTFVSDLTGKVDITNVPDGLTAVLTRTSATTATLTFTGAAAAHANAQDIDDFTLSFQDGAFTGDNAADVFNAVRNDLKIDFDDPTPDVALTYSTTSVNESAAFDGTVAQTITITLSGDTFVSDLTDTFDITNVPAGLSAVLTRDSDTSATLSFTGTASAHSDLADVNDIALNFLDDAFTGGNASIVAGNNVADIRINFGDIGAADTAQEFIPQGQGSDASTAFALDANFMVVGDDEANVLRVYDRKGGLSVALNNHGGATEWDFGDAVGFGDELDLEAGARIGDTYYFTGSSSNSKSGGDDPNRENLFSVKITGSGADTTFSDATKLTANTLEAMLVAWDHGNAHGLGADYFGFADASGSNVIPENVFGFSIEGLTAKANANSLLFGFRAPQTGTTGHDNAVVVELSLGVDGSLSGASIGATAYELNLGGRGIRAIEKSATGDDYLILAGPAGAASSDVTNDFRMFRWDGASDTPTELNVNLDTLRDVTGGSFETIVDVRSTDEGTWVQLLQDDGDTLWPGKTQVSKDLPGAEQKFNGNWVQIGGDVTDSSGPVLKASTPADNATGTSINTDLVLRFDEGVKIGSGNLVIRKVSDNGVVATIDVSDEAQVNVAFNTVTINPSANLAANTAYYVEAEAGVLTDHYGNDWAGLAGSAAFNFTTGTPLPAPKLLVTEVNSNADGGDFFELYNYGTSTIDLTGWKWVDDKADPGHEDAREFSGVTELAAGARMIVITDDIDVAAFRTAWGIDASVQIATGPEAGPGLGGSGDAVVVFDASGNVAAALNYKTTAVTASDGTIIDPLVRADGNPLVSAHAGVAVGGSGNGVSAVWDGVDPTNPEYGPAVAGQGGAFAQPDASGNVGSPGSVTLPSVMITEVNSTTSDGSGGGDFFELYNYGATAVDLSGWKWTDEAANFNDAGKTIALPQGTMLAAGEKLLIVNTANEAAFRAAWGANLSASTKVLALGGQGLGGNDTVVLFNNHGTVVAAVNYKLDDVANQIVASDGTAIMPFTGSAGGHTGVAGGAAAGASLVWDGVSTANPDYVAAVVNTNGAYAQSGTPADIGSPGRVTDDRGAAERFFSIAATNADQAEGHTGSTTYTFTVTRTGDDGGTASVAWSVAGSGADAADDEDFDDGVLPAGGTLNFAVYETSKVITIEVASDTLQEADEFFTVTLSGAVNATIQTGSATGAIRNDDATTTPPPTPGAPTVVEGSEGDDEIVIDDDQPITTIVTGGGNDIVTGGAGTETVIVPVTLDEVEELGIDRHDDGTIVLHTPTGTVTLDNVERVLLSDGRLFAIDIDLPSPGSEGGHTGQVLAIAFGSLGVVLHDANRNEISEWVKVADELDDLSALAQAVIDTMAPGISNQDLVNHLFFLVTGQHANAEQTLFWTSQIGAGNTYETQGDLLAMVAGMPEITDALTKLIGAPQVQLDSAAFDL